MVVIAIRSKDGGKSCKVVGGIKATSTTANATAYFIALDGICGGDVIPRALEATGKSSSPLEPRRMVLEGDGGDPATTTGLVMVYAQAISPSKAADIVAAVLDALKKSVVAVVCEIGEIGEIGGDGDQMMSLATVQLVLVLSPGASTVVDTIAKVPGVQEKSRSCI